MSRTLQHSTEAKYYKGNTLQRSATHCNILHHTASHCITMQHTATHCKTLQATDTCSEYTTSHRMHTFCTHPPASVAEPGAIMDDSLCALASRNISTSSVCVAAEVEAVLRRYSGSIAFVFCAPAFVCHCVYAKAKNEREQERA